MAVDLREGHKVRRRIKINGIEAPVLLTLSTTGVDFRVPGSHRGVSQTWEALIGACCSPKGVDPFFSRRPIDYLRFLAARLATKKKARPRKTDRSLSPQM
jgi:hypothetical protein